jgi:hypothetical protein
MILCRNNWKSNEGKECASGLLLSVVPHFLCGNCLSQNHKLFGYFLAAKSIKRNLCVIDKESMILFWLQKYWQ